MANATIVKRISPYRIPWLVTSKEGVIIISLVLKSRIFNKEDYIQ